MKVSFLFGTYFIRKVKLLQEDTLINIETVK